MSEKRIGVMVGGPPASTYNAACLLAEIEKMEEMGIPASWLVTSEAGLDAITLFAGAAMRTERALLGTCIVPIFPRHPVVMAQQVQVIGQLAPGRFRLGVGPANRASTEEPFGLKFRAPLGHLSEYVHILKALLQEGTVDFDGRYYKAHAQIGSPMDIPVMASALQSKSFELCGAEADGAIGWVCPIAYVRDVALPAMKKGAERANRPVPPLVQGMPVCVHDDLGEVRKAVREEGGFGHPQRPYYQRMFTDAGYPEASNGKWSDSMMDASMIFGNESRVAEKLEEVFSTGVSEVILQVFPAGDDHEASMERTLRLLAEVSRRLDVAD